MITDQRLINKIFRIYRYCGLCNKPVYKSDIDKIEYIKTRRHTDAVYHTDCIKRYSQLGVKVD